jgi:ubiquinone/menaquinone biosynthesis C-methylase UbiE
MTQQALPPSWQHVGRHAVFPESAHDDVARFDFLANLNIHLASRVSPQVQVAYEKRVLPAFEKEHGRAPKDRHEVRKAMASDSMYQTWSALRRNTMEMRQQAGRALVLRQLDELIGKVKAINEAQPEGLELDPTVKVPRYVSAVDIHCMPGGYHTEETENDVLAPANYDAGIFVTTAGALGRFNDSGGQAVGQWLKTQHPDFKPKRILDLGCTMGHNAVPLAQAFPDAEVIAIDVSATMLRYAHARARAMGVKNITFRQANAEGLDYPDGHFDLITTAMFWHESSSKAMPIKLREINRLLAPGGLTLHLEQPQYEGKSVIEQFLRDWDTYNNNEPFWGVMHEYDLKKMMADAGFDPALYFEMGIRGLVDPEIFPTAKEEGEDHGRAALWNTFGAWKAK